MTRIRLVWCLGLAVAAVVSACSQGQTYVETDGGTSAGHGGASGGSHAAAGGSSGRGGSSSSGGASGSGAGTSAGAGGAAGAGGVAGRAGDGGSSGGAAGGRAGAGAGGTGGTGGAVVIGQGGSAGGGAAGRGGAPATGGAPGSGGAPGTGGTSCQGKTHACAGTCVDDSSPATCGKRCDACAPPAGGTATCDGTSCGFTCGGSTPKQCLSAGICVPSSGCCANSDCPTNAGGQTGTCDSAKHTCSYACTGTTTSCTTGGGTICIPAGGCCTNADCPGNCMLCNQTTHACVAATNMADPNGRCAGTCDSSGACKSKQGQTCGATPGGCVAGTSCADGFCCNSACTGTCTACDVPGHEGTCFNVPASAAPHGSRACLGAGTSCGGTCDGAGACAYPTVACGSASCSGGSYVPAGTCHGGSCTAAQPQTCANNFTCSQSGCNTSCSGDGDCQSGTFCQGGTCHRAAIAVATGFAHSCALIADGRLYCWGKNGYGQLGNSKFSNAPTPQRVNVTWPANQQPVDVACSDQGTCALLSDGTVWCWGENDTGTVGNGTFSDGAQLGVPTPGQVQGLAGGAEMIGSGANHNCAVIAGAAYCWGANGAGQLGNGDVAMSSPWGSATPVAVLETSIAAIDGGAAHTCAITQQNSVSCWGANDSNQLGVGTDIPSSPAPRITLSNASAAAVAATSYGTCLLFKNGTVSCWGSDTHGEAGQGIQSDPLGKNGVTGISTAKAISGGYQHVCVLNGNGTISCWGNNNFGQLGNPAAGVQIGSPVSVSSLPSGKQATAIAAGGIHTCAILNGGSVWCWGDNSMGELGNGSQTTSGTPVQVVGW